MDNQQQSANLSDTEQLDSESIEQTSAPTDRATQVLQLENMINGFMADIQKLQQQVKEQGQMYKDALENDADYSNVLAKGREVAKEKKRIQEKLTQEPSLQVLDTKIKDLKSELKEAQDALSHYLVQYFEQSGLRQITGADGEIHEIVTTVKLVKKKDS